MEQGKIIFTLGTSTRSPQEFLALLAHYGIETLVDVRRFPTSRFEHFKRENLTALLAEEGIEYVYLGEVTSGLALLSYDLALSPLPRDRLSGAGRLSLGRL